MLERTFKGVIWTNHALQRLKERGIKQGDAWATWRSPQESRKAESSGGYVFYRTYGDQRIEVVAKKNEKGQWIILSVWSKKVPEQKRKKFFLFSLLKTIFK